MNGDFPAKVAVVGLGYVGLPLAEAFGRVLPTVGYDHDEARCQELRKGYDRNGEVPPEDLQRPTLAFTADPAALADADVVVVAVPTPVDRAKRPDLGHLLDASRRVGEALRARRAAHPDRPPAVVVYESTVYPGCTEEACVPALEAASGLRAGDGFRVGYSPERINPGDTRHRLPDVVKVVAAQDPATLEVLAGLYGRIVRAGVHRAPDIRTAEAAKVIENVQRDLNIALMNELSLLFERLGLDTREVLRASRTKWNFLPFEPGLVGGHCIPVDPYYLTHKAEEVGFHPELILAGRRVNDAMGFHVARQTVRLLIQAGRRVRGARVLVLGVTFKEDVPDTRNSRVLDVLQELAAHGVEVHVHDPVALAPSVRRLGYAVAADPFGVPDTYDGVVLAVPHQTFLRRDREAYARLVARDGAPGVLADVRGALPWGPASGLLYWRL